MNMLILSFVKVEIKEMFGISQLVYIIYPLIRDSYRTGRVSYYTFGRP